MLYDGTNPASGITSNGTSCTGYSDTTGNDSCPIHIDLQWQPICKPLPCSPQQIKLTADIKYNPQSASKKLQWNVANYHLDVFKDILGLLVNCGPVTISTYRSFNVTTPMNITYALTGGGGGGSVGSALLGFGANGAKVTGMFTALAGETLLFVPGGGGGGGGYAGGGGSGYMGGGGGGNWSCADGGAGGSSAILKGGVLINFAAGGDGSYCGESVYTGTGAPARGGSNTGGAGGAHYTGGPYGTAGSGVGAPGGPDLGGAGTSAGGSVLCYPNPYGETACGGNAAAGCSVPVNVGGPLGYGGSGGGYGSGGGGGSTPSAGWLPVAVAGVGGNNGGPGGNGANGGNDSTGTTDPGGYGGYGGNGTSPLMSTETRCGYYGGGWCRGVGYGPGNGGCGGRFFDGGPSFCHGGGGGHGDGGGGGNIIVTYTATSCTL